MWVIVIILVIVLIILYANGIISDQKLLEENNAYFEALKEDDYEFLLHAKYGENIDAQSVFQKRIKNTILIFIIAFLVCLLLGQMSFLTFLICGFIAGFIYKQPYLSLKGYYKSHMHQIDLLLPYYLKTIEVLVQHYTVPVAISKSIKDAPDLFKPGLKELISRIEAGDSSIDPYMDFAKKYPVRDSMRMMRLLYRLGLGLQENKDEQLILLSKTVSALQNKAREQKYAERLEKMQSKTMIMLGGTGFAVIVLLVVAMMQMLNI